MEPRRIVIDGKTYDSVADMPEEVRRRYEEALRTLRDRDENRVPDVLETHPDISRAAGGIKVVVDGQEIYSLDDLPPEKRAKFDQAIHALDDYRNGILDFIEGGMNIQQTPRPAARGSTPAGHVSTPDTSSVWLLVLVGAFVLLICTAAALGLWHFFVG